MPNTRATEWRNVKGFNYPRGRPEELRRTWNNGNESPAREEPKRGKSEGGAEGGLGEEETGEEEVIGIAWVETEGETSKGGGVA